MHALDGRQAQLGKIAGNTAPSLYLLHGSKNIWPERLADLPSRSWQLSWIYKPTDAVGYNRIYT
jgi:hypothetical protein